MKKVLLALASAALATSAFAAPQLVFSAVPNDPTPATSDANRADGSATFYYFPVTGEIGDEVTLEPGTSRVLREYQVLILTNYSDTLSFDPSDNKARVRFYQMNGPAVGSRADSPGTMFYDSGEIQLKINDVAIRVLIPNGVTVPDRFTYTVEIINSAQVTGEQLGMVSYGPPVKGTTDVNIWTRPGGTWTNTDATSVQPDLAAGRAAPCFAMQMWADSTPVSPYDAFSDASTGYSNLVGVVAPLDQPMGDDLNLVGNNRKVTSLEVAYRTDVTAPQGDEGIQVAFYNNRNDASNVATLYDPITPAFYTSATSLLDTSGTAAVLKTIKVPIPGGVDVPDDMVYIALHQGLGQVVGDRWVQCLSSRVLNGNSQGSFPAHVQSSNTWIFYWFGNFTPTSDNLNFPGGNYLPNMRVRLNAEKVIEPSKVEIIRGTPVGGATWDRLLKADDVRLGMNPGSVGIATLDKILIRATFYLPVSTVSAMKVGIHSKATNGVTRQRVVVQGTPNEQLELFSPLPFGASPDREVELTVTTPANHINTTAEPGFNRVVVEVSYNNTGPVPIAAWQAQMDRLYLDITP